MSQNTRDWIAIFVGIATGYVIFCAALALSAPVPL